MNLLSIADLTPDSLGQILHLAARCKLEPRSWAGSREGRSIGLFFAKQSLRTWVSCEVAAIELGVHPVLIRNEEAGIGTRESPEDLGRVLERYLDLLALRVYEHQHLERIAAVATVPVVNLLSEREHPCQALADLQTIAERRSLAETTLAYVGDGNNVARSLLQAATMAGMRVRIASPSGYEPVPAVVAMARRHGEVELTLDPVEAVEGADVVYTDVWTSMGQETEVARRREAFRAYQVNSQLLEHASPNVIFMHCLPAHRGEEVTDEVIDGPRSVVFDQAENRLHTFKAVLLHLLV